MKYFKFLVLTCLSFFLFLILPQDSFAATYYVAGDTGLDTNNGSITTPWKTIQKAADTMVAGDTVNVKGGITYTGNNNCPGSYAVLCIKSPNTTYQAWPNTGVPIIDHETTSSGIYLNAKNNVTISGFEITAIESTSGILVMSSSNSVIKNLTIRGSFYGIWMYQMTNSYVYNTNFIGTQFYALNITNSSSNIVFNNNTFVNDAIGARSSSSTSISSNHNLFFNNGTNYVGITPGVADVNQDAMFINISSLNFHLQRLSPAINTGTDLTASGVTTDILGVPRPQGAGFDIGAYEYYDIPVTVTGSYPVFSGTASTINTGTISSIQYSVDGGSWQTSGVTGTTTFSIVIPQELYIPDGNHTLRVKATDSYTNETDSSIYAVTSFSKDTVVKTTSVNNSCTATKPEGTPVITSITNLTPSSVKLLFSDSWTNTVDSYFVEYGTKPNVYQYSTQSIGGKGTKETTISNLTPNKTYYFRIRNGNNCNVGNWSTPVSIKNEELTINNLKTPTPEIKTNTKEVVTPKSTTTPVQVPTNQKTNTNIFTIIINWLTNAFNKIF